MCINSSDEIYHAALSTLNTVELEQPARLLGGEFRDRGVSSGGDPEGHSIVNLSIEKIGIIRSHNAVFYRCPEK